MMKVIKVSNFRKEGFGPFRLELAGSFGAFDNEKLLSLSDYEFAERYLGEMTRYFYEHGKTVLENEKYKVMMGLDEGLEPIGCSSCRKPIDSPQDLRRYYGNSLHRECFIRRWNKERGVHIELRGRDINFKYWEKISELN